MLSKYLYYCSRPFIPDGYNADGEIIWENPNPTQSYSRTYNVPLITGKKFSDHKRISIECADSNIEYFDINMFINSPQTGVTQGLNNSGFQTGGSAIFNRCFRYASDTTFDIGSCFLGGTIYDNALIPLRIKGYK